MRALVILALLRVVRGVAPIVNIPVLLNPANVDTKPDNIYYSFTPVAGSAQSYPICGQVLGTGSVAFSQDGTGKHTITYDLVPFTSSTIALSEVATCDPSVAGDCGSCTVNIGLQLLSIEAHYYTLSDGGLADSIVTNTVTYWTQLCQLAYKLQCGASVCPNGYYASEYRNVDPFGYVTNAVKCLPCKPGTWLTCVFTRTCTWTIPTSASDPFTPPYGMYGIPGQVPVGGCYTCPTAGGGKEHYNGTQNGIWIYDHPRNPLQWICPGGADPPQFCPDGFAGANYDHTVCVCGDGNYPIDRTTCAPCPPGYQCSNGTATECPDGTYQA